jgi:hypothetical protein
VPEVRRLVPGEPLAPVDEYQLELDARPVREGVFRDFRWFDLQTAKNVVGAGGRSSQPQVWVDQDRGIFYFRRTD